MSQTGQTCILKRLSFVMCALSDSLNPRNKQQSEYCLRLTASHTCTQFQKTLINSVNLLLRFELSHQRHDTVAHVGIQHIAERKHGDANRLVASAIVANRNNLVGAYN